MATTAPAPVSDDIWEDIDDAPPAPVIPILYLGLPPIVDLLETSTSVIQNETVRDVMPYLAGDLPKDAVFNAHGIPPLNRKRMVGFLNKALGGLPSPFYAADASRPWFLYWCLGGLRLLGENVDGHRDGMIATAKYLQNKTGGFGGGLGYDSHLATTYATVLSLLIVGGKEAYDTIDRKAMWEWLSLLKQEDGGFAMVDGGEIDVRGAFCATVLISLLNLPLEIAPSSPLKGKVDSSFNLHTNLGDYVRRCQTYEGGISGKPDGEAHGAYAFCALGCLTLIDSPFDTFTRYLNVPSLISWLSARQNAPEGGLSGRTNKLVDGCYSHWVGGCWPLIEVVLNGPAIEGAAESENPYVESIMSREGLIRYIMCCCQDDQLRGGLAGMRDKPGKGSDCYHTLYVLAGLSAAQHYWTVSADADTGKYDKWKAVPYEFPEGPIFDKQALLEPIHPVYVLPVEAVKNTKAYFKGKPVI